MAITKKFKRNNQVKRAYYQAEIYVRGVRLACKTFDTLAAACNWHDKTKVLLLNGNSEEKKNKTLSAVLHEYKQKAFCNLRLSSRQARESRFRYILESPIANLQVRELNPLVVSEWIQWLKAHPSTENKNRFNFREEVRMLRVILRWYREELDYTYSVPILSKHYKAADYRPKVKQPDRYLRAEEVMPWLNALKERPDKVYYALGVCMVLTGLRLGEAAGLCWDAVNYTGPRPSIKIIRTLCWGYKTKRPYFQECAKTDGSIRYLNIDPFLAGIFQKMAEERNYPTSGHLFFNAVGYPLSDNAVRNNFNAAFRKIGVRWTGTHIMRHSFATLALTTDQSLSTIQASLGHQSQKETEKYAKIIALQRNTASAKVASLVGLKIPVNHGENHGQETINA